MKNSPFLNHVLYSNFFISVGAVCQGLLTFLYLELPADYSLLFYLFISTFLVYHVQVFVFNKPDRNLKTTDTKLQWLIEHKRTIRILSLALIPFVAVLFLEFTMQVKIAVAFQFLMVFVYYFPFFTNQGFRKIPGLKLVLISLSWTIGVVILPMLIQNIDLFTKKSVLLITERFLLITALTLAFDVRDFIADAKHQLKTIPHLIGLQSAKKFAIILLITFGVLSILHHPTEWIISSLTIAIVSTFLWIKADTNKHPYFYAIGIDGILILQYILSLLMIISLS